MQKRAMTTNRDITQKFPSSGHFEITVPQGAEVIFVDGKGGGYAVKEPEKYGACPHDVNHYYFYIPADAVNNRLVDAKLMREPLAKKSDNWQDTAFHWLVTIGGQHFDYYTGAAWVEKARVSYMPDKPIPPSYDDVIHSLLMDASACEQSFEDWCSEYGYDSDSIKALETYRACQKNADKLRKAGVNIEAERERLADY